MRTLRLTLITLAFGAVLAGCTGAKSGALAELKTTPAEAEAYIAKLSTESLKGKATAAADIASVRDALPKEIALTWDTLSFDAAAGATVLTGVKLTPAETPTVGISISEVRLWDFDAAFAKARLSGQRLAETASLARRIEARNIAVFGLETLIGPAMDAAELAAGAAAATDPQIAAQFQASADMKLDGYELSLARLLFDDVMLRPYELKPAQLPPNSDFAEVMPFLQGYAAAARTFAADTMSATGLAAKLEMSRSSEKVAIDIGAESYGARGMRGGDTDVSFMRGLKLDVTAPNLDKPGTSIAISGGLDLFTSEHMRLDKLLAYLGKGEWPPRTDSDLMSLGLTQIKGERFGLNGHDIYSVADATVDLRDWYWFIPTKLRLSANDVTYDVGAIMDLVKDMGGNVSVSLDQSGKPAAAPVQSIDPRIMQALAKYGLDKPSLDYALGWSWDPKTGVTGIDGAFGLDNYLRFNLKLDGGLPTFKAVSDLIPDDVQKTDAGAIGKVFETASTLKSAELNVIDEGGLDRGFALAVELGKLFPVEPGQPDFFATQTPQTLRQMAVSAIYSLADQAGAQIPATRNLLRPLAAFLEKGGKVHVTLAPKMPLSAGSMGTSVATGQSDPAVLLQQLNLKVEHTPPAQ